MANKVSEPELKALSASRVKTLESCSWLYWCNYHLKLPQKPTEGAKKGSICHTVFEVLLLKNRYNLFKKIIADGSITAVPSIHRLVKKHIKKLAVLSEALSFTQIDEMILVGLKNDFYVKDGTLIAPEYKFDIISKAPKYRIKGFMDKPFMRGNEIIIDDFKSSKNKFAGEDKESNTQALFYSFAATQIWPDKIPTVRFIFLQFPRDPIMEVKFTPDALLGFKYYLEATQLRVEGFNEHVAKSNFAADQPAGKDTFSGKSLCGFAKSPTQLKKDGTPMWHCPYRFAFEYYAIKRGTETIQAAFKKADLRPLKVGEKIELCQYAGCPKHVNVLDSFKPTPIVGKKKYANVLDDF